MAEPPQGIGVDINEPVQQAVVEVFLPNPFDWDEVPEDTYLSLIIMCYGKRTKKVGSVLHFILFLYTSLVFFCIYTSLCRCTDHVEDGPPELPDLNLNAEDEGEVGLDLNQIPGTTAINLFP
jgi:hypothetical protein